MGNIALPQTDMAPPCTPKSTSAGETSTRDKKKRSPKIAKATALRFLRLFDKGLGMFKTEKEKIDNLREHDAEFQKHGYEAFWKILNKR